MPKPAPPSPLNAAECARRTGLTIRALRVYERQGLIKPIRSAKGWRLYGPSEMQRLNIVVTLKTFGMTLALEELCELTRSMEMGNHHAIVRELINEQITPQEERAYMTWAAARPPEDVKAMQEYGAAVRVLFRSLQELRKNYCRPDTPEVQSLITQWNVLAVRHGLRQFMATLMEWNPAVAQKWLQVGERAISISSAQHQDSTDEGLWAYFSAAQEASPWHQALRQITDEAIKLVENRVSPSSPPATALATNLTRLCADHCLGDPIVYARWAGAMQFRNDVEENARRKSAWGYLVKALQEHAPHST